MSEHRINYNTRRMDTPLRLIYRSQAYCTVAGTAVILIGLFKWSVTR